MIDFPPFIGAIRSKSAHAAFYSKALDYRLSPSIAPYLFKSGMMR